MDDGVLIRPFADFDDDVDIIWPRQFVRSEENEWRVIVTIWRHRSPGPEAISLPIGYMPLLRAHSTSSGHPFHEHPAGHSMNIRPPS